MCRWRKWSEGVLGRDCHLFSFVFHRPFWEPVIANKYLWVVAFTFADVDLCTHFQTLLAPKRSRVHCVIVLNFCHYTTSPLNRKPFRQRRRILASCRALMAKIWKRRSVLTYWVISRTKRWNANFLRSAHDYSWSYGSRPISMGFFHSSGDRHTLARCFCS